jgi:hypothetical protein
VTRPGPCLLYKRGDPIGVRYAPHHQRADYRLTEALTWLLPA